MFFFSTGVIGCIKNTVKNNFNGVISHIKNIKVFFVVLTDLYLHGSYLKTC